MKNYLLAIGCLAFTACVKTGYHVEEGHVVRYGGLGAGKRLVTGADPRHFNALNDTYGKDRQHVFIRDGILAGADPGSFQILSWGYTRDRSRVWWDNKTVTTDAVNFRVVPNPGDPTAIIYGRDSNHVYMREEKLEDADPKTFEFVPMFNGYDLTRDKNHVRAAGSSQPIEGVDAATFKKLGDIYFRDAHGVWGLAFGSTPKWTRMPLADPATFVSTGKFEGKDKNHIFKETTVAEPPTP